MNIRDMVERFASKESGIKVWLDKDEQCTENGMKKGVREQKLEETIGEKVTRDSKKSLGVLIRFDLDTGVPKVPLYVQMHRPGSSDRVLTLERERESK